MSRQFTYISLFATILSQWDVSREKFGLPSPGKASCDSVALPNLSSMLGMFCFHNPPNSHIDHRIFNVRTYVNACDCTQECTDTVRESALKADSGRKEKKNSFAPWTRTRVSYIPTPSCCCFVILLLCLYVCHSLFSRAIISKIHLCIHSFRT